MHCVAQDGVHADIVLVPRELDVPDLFLLCLCEMIISELSILILFYKNFPFCVKYACFFLLMRVSQ
jgi:hypothetical protein